MTASFKVEDHRGHVVAETDDWVEGDSLASALKREIAVRATPAPMAGED